MQQVLPSFRCRRDAFQSREGKLSPQVGFPAAGGSATAANWSIPLEGQVQQEAIGLQSWRGDGENQNVFSLMRENRRPRCDLTGSGDQVQSGEAVRLPRRVTSE